MCLCRSGEENDEYAIVTQIAQIVADIYKGTQKSRKPQIFFHSPAVRRATLLPLGGRNKGKSSNYFEHGLYGLNGYIGLAESAEMVSNTN